LQPAFFTYPRARLRPLLLFLPRLTSGYRLEPGNIQLHKVKERFNLDVSPQILTHFIPDAGTNTANNSPI
jgi:hypothetical protein